VSVIAPSITGIDISGGSGVNNDYGVYVVGTLGSTTTTSITISANSLGLGSNEYGIFVDNGGIVRIADTGTLQLIGTGSISGLSGTANQGIVFNSTSTLAVGAVTGATANLTGVGGTGSGGSNDGVNFSGILDMAGTSTLNYINCYGGSGVGGHNIGVVFAPNVASTYGTTPTISFNHCSGGIGSGGGPNNIGLTVSGVTTPLASNATFTFFDIAGGSIGAGNSGITFSGLTVNTGNIILRDILGGGIPSVANFNTGVTVEAGTTLTAPSIQAYNIVGGPGTGNDYGFFVQGTVGTVATTTLNIVATSVGNSANSIGIYVDDGGKIQIGDGGTLQLIGTGSVSEVAPNGNDGIFFNSTATLAIGSTTGATANLTGVGGGLLFGSHLGVDFTGILQMVGTSTLNFINCHGGTGLFGGNVGVAFAPNVASTYGTTPTISFNHCSGGESTSISGNNVGVTVTGVATSLASNATFTFFDIAGGLSPIPGNSGVIFSNLTVNTGSITLQDITGGGTSGSNLNTGVTIANGTILTAPTIIANVITGGPGSLSDYGFYIPGGTLGSASTTSITISASSLGTGSEEIGIFVDAGGIIEIADTGTLQLTGTGSQVATGTANQGIQFSATGILAIGSGVGGAANLTGVGGTGTDDAIGVNFLGTLHLAGTSTLNFTDCHGGSGGIGSNIGVFFGPTVASTYGTTPTIAFNHCSGGDSQTFGINSGVSISSVTTPLASNATFSFFDIAGGTSPVGTSANNGVLFSGLTVNTGSITLVDIAGGGSSLSSATYGVKVSNGTTLTAPTISATGILGGPGSGTNIGWYVNGSTVAASTAISISAASAGLGTGEVGIQVDGGGVMQTTGIGTITLNGLGGSGIGTAGYGIYVTGASSAITSVNGAISMTGAASASNTAGIQVDTAGIVNATGTGSLTLATPTPQPIALGNSTLSTNSGNLTLNGRINAIAATPAISSTSGTITFNEPFVLTATPPTVTATNGSIVFNSTVDGAFGFTPTAGTSITFAGALGSTTPLSSLTVTAPSIVVGANQTVNSATTYSYIGAVTTTAPVTFTELGSAVLSFSSTITGNFPLTLLTSNSIAPIFVGGAINTSGVAAGASGGSLTVAAGGGVTFTGAINTAGSAVATIQGGSGGDVTVHSLGSIITTDITVSGGAGTSSGGNSGSIFLQPNATSSTNATFGTVPNGTIEFNGAVITASGGTGPTAGSNGDILLAPLGRTSPMTVATMFTNPLALDSLTITGGNLIMGAHEALTVFNNATFTLTGYTALGDVVVLNNFSLTSGTVIIAPSNYLIPRASQLLLKNDGTFYTSPTPHVLSGGTFSLSGGVTPSGFNEGKPIAGITLAQLTFMGVPLNLDAPAVVPPPPPPPPPTPSITARGKQIRRLSIADAELNDLALLFVDPRAFWPYWSRMCCCTDKKVSYQLPHWAENCLTGRKRRRPRCSEHPEIDCHEKRVIQFTPFLHRSDNI
jgi:hypothetical protein